MASHCQPYYSCHHPTTTPTTTTTTTSSCYCCSCYGSYTPSHHPLPPDPHLPAISPHLHHHHHHHPPSPPPQPHPFPTYQYHPSQLHTQPPQDPPRYFQDHHHQREESTHPVIISSLLHRISALEASLKRYSSLSSSSSSSSYTLRDAAARTIQTHFRAFLVRRSRTLGQLKELACIKSTLNALKSSVSENTHFDPQALSLKAMDLLLKLDSIQGGDPMIKDGKRSINRELIRLMDFIDEVNVKRNELARRIVKNVRCGGNNNNFRDVCSNKKRANVESVKVGRRGDVIGKLKERIERLNGLSRVSEEDGEEDEELESPIIALARRSEVGITKGGGLRKGNTRPQVKAERSVSFVENGNVYRVFSSNDPISNGDCNSMDGSDSAEVQGELVGNLGRKVEEIGLSSKETDNDKEEAEIEDEGSTRSSDGEQDAKDSVKVRGALDRRSNDHEEDGSFVFHAPLPVKMESRADFMNKRKSVKV